MYNKHIWGDIMDGKLLILCDEDPRSEDKLTIRDKHFLDSEMWDPEDNSDMLFVCFDSLIPEDRTFIEECKLYGTFRAKPEPDFMIRQKGKTDPKYGTIHGSVQENSYLETYLNNIEILKYVQSRGEDIEAEMLEMACQYQFSATANFLRNISKIISKHGIVRILPAFKKDADPIFTKYRLEMLEAWESQNNLPGEDKVCASLLKPMEYSDFGEVYSRAVDEMMKIMSLPIFGDEEKPPKL